MNTMQEPWPPRRKRSGSGHNRRQFVRIGTELRGYIAQDFRLSECEILDMSRGGARVRTDGTLADQAHLTLGFGRFGTIAGEVVWRRNGMLGLKYVDTPQAIQQTLSALMPQACLAS